VQNNIVRFGGDPAKVTIFGQSAGARSADFHLLTMQNTTSFRAVIMQSGSSELTPLADAKRARTSASRGPSFQQLANTVGCNVSKVVLECMRQVPAIQIKQAVEKLTLYFGSTDDGGYTTVKDQGRVRRARQAARVPLLLGTNADEQRGSMSSWRAKSLKEYLDTEFDGQSASKEKLAKAYAVSSTSAYTTDFEAIAAIATDMSFTCLTAREARISAEAGYRKPVSKFPNKQQSSNAYSKQLGGTSLMLHSQIQRNFHAPEHITG